jgi:hypothetical protein
MIYNKGRMLQTYGVCRAYQGRHTGLFSGPITLQGYKTPGIIIFIMFTTTSVSSSYIRRRGIRTIQGGGSSMLTSTFLSTLLVILV